MFKKVISVIIICLMMVSTLTGCGVNELGYLNLSKEQSKISEYSIKNNSNLEISETLMGEKYNIDFEIEGVANVSNIESMYMSVDMLLKVNDIEVKKPINFKIVDNKIYVSKDVLLEVIKLSKLQDDIKGIEKVIQELYDNNLKDIEYILLTDLGATYKDVDSKEITDMAMNYLTTAFKGFDSKIIKKTSKGYSLELNFENILAFLKNISTYLSKNKELVFDETVKYVENLFKVMDVENLNEINQEDEDEDYSDKDDKDDKDDTDTDEEDEINQEDIDEIVEKLKENKQDFFDFIDEFALMLEQEETKEYIEMIKGSKIKQEVYKIGNTFNEKANIEVVFNGEEMVQFTSNTTITAKKVNKTSLTGKVVKLEDLQDMYEKVQNKVNPVKKMELEWYKGGSSADVYGERLEGNTDYDYQPFVIVEGRIYLPLRYISENFGEEVEWDNVNKKAYIIRANQKIDMTGLIKDSKTMIKVKDFEKLGYKIEYKEIDDLSIATIVRD